MRSPPVGTIYLLKRAELAVRSCMEVALAEFGLTPAQFLMLYRLRDTTEPSGADIAREIGVRPQSIFQIVRPPRAEGPLEARAAARPSNDPAYAAHARRT